MAPAQGLKWHSSISEDDPKHPVPLEQILDLRRVPLPQVTEQRCQDCQTDHRGVTEINMAEFIRLAWSVSSNMKNVALFTLVQNSPRPLLCTCTTGMCRYLKYFFIKTGAHWHLLEGNNVVCRRVFKLHLLNFWNALKCCVHRHFCNRRIIVYLSSCNVKNQ